MYCGKAVHAILLALPLLVATHGPAFAAPADSLHKIEQLCETAKQNRVLHKYEDVERARRERWQLIEELEAESTAVDSTWLVGFLAIREVDGDENVAAEKLPDVGLINRLDYRESCKRLREAWASMKKATDGPILGEVAVRLFEVAQQARGVYRDALNPDSIHCVATREELRTVLAEAQQRDPCCVMATPLLHFLDTPDPKEAFLRAEQRKSFRERQSALVSISHPAVFLEEKTSEVRDKRERLPKGLIGDENFPSVKVSEQADKPLLPWHAAVELDKANSLQHLLDELEYGAYLKPDIPGPSYVLPGKIIAGRDRMSDRFILLYGRYLFCRVVDSKGDLRAAVLYRDEQHQWRHRYLNLLWRSPQQSEQNALSTLVESTPSRLTFKLADNEFSIRDFPIEACEDLIASQTQIVCLRDPTQLCRLKYSPVRNDVRALDKLLTSQAADPNAVRTTPEVIGKLASMRDATKHPLIELMNDQRFNPLVVVSDSDKDEVTPQFFAENTATPFLLLDDGSKLVFELSGSEGAPRCTIAYPGATVSIPLHFHSVPIGLLKGGRMGSAFFKLLRDAGYTEPEASTEIQRCIEKPSHIPVKFLQRLKSKVVSTRSDPFSSLGQMLAEAGWRGAPYLSVEMNRLYGVYGFRYLRDKRGNWMTSRRFSSDQGLAISADASESAGAETSAASPPFDYRAQDGATPIESTMVYSMGDYNRIKQNIVSEHLLKLVRFHPAVPVVEKIRAEAERELVDPSEYAALQSKVVDAVKSRINKLDTFVNSSAKVRELLDSGKFERLYEPFAKWAVNDDALQAQTLDSLHNAYVSRIVDFALSAYDMQVYPMAYDALLELSKVAGNDQDARKEITTFRQSIDERFNQRQADWMRKSTPVLAVQLESARYFARARLYHKSVLHYNDFLQQIFLPQHRREGHDLFQRVVTSDEAQKFGAGIEKVIQSQQLAVTAQMELAGVLNAAGLRESAYFVWRRVADDEKYLMHPTAKIAREIIESYGLRASDRVTGALELFRQSAVMAEKAIAQHCVSPEWRTCSDMEHAKKQELGMAIEVIESFTKLLQQAKDSGERLSVGPEDERRCDRATEKMCEADSIDIATWLRYRQALLPRGEACALRARRDQEAYVIHPVQFCPRSYDPGVGFNRPFASMLAETSSADIRDWCGLEEAEAAKSPIAEKACFLLAWYWLDENNKANARAAFMFLADILIDRAEHAEEPIDRLRYRLSAFAAILGGYSIFDEVPGVKAVRSGLGAYMVPQLVHFQREWFAAGGYGPHASSECRVLERHLDATQDHAMLINRSESNDRYFLADYTYMYGAVPNWLLFQAINSPQLFKELSPDEIAGLKAEAVEGLRWTLLSEVHASYFFDNLKLDAAIKEEIVNLGR